MKDRKAEEAVEALAQNWRAEKDGARVYRELAESEKDPRRKAILRRVAEAEDRHAARWEKKLADFGAPLPELRDTWGKRLSRWFNRNAGTDIAIRRQEAAEDRDKSRYEAQPARALGEDAEARQILKEIAREEKAHGKVLQQMAPQLGPRNRLDAILKRERWHGRGGS
jgi:vacuolar iron transporter family protein